MSKFQENEEIKKIYQDSVVLKTDFETVQKVEKYFLKEDEITVNKYFYDFDVPEHLHNFIEIAYVFDGESTHHKNSTEFKMGRGCLLFFYNKDRHSFIPQSKCILSSIMFSEDKVSDNREIADCLKMLREYGGMLQFAGQGLVEIENVIDNMIEEYLRKRTGYKHVVRNMLENLLIFMCREINSSTNDKAAKEMQNRIPANIISFIENNYERKITLESVSQLGCYNPAYFSRLFKSTFHVTLTEYINRLRFEKAVSMLKETDYTIDQICYTVGFGDKKFFYKYFKQNTGVTPMQYREANGRENNGNDI